MVEPAVIIGIVIFVVIVALVMFRNYASALIYDYGVDFGLSTLDNFIGGMGLIGLDVGDALAALIIFARERKISGNMIAFIVAWEALNFLPLGLIPGIGEGIEVFFNLFPAVFISRILFSYFSKAEHAQTILSKEIDLAKSLQIKIPEIVQAQKKIALLMKAGNPIDAYNLAQKTEKEVSQAFIGQINGIIGEIDEQIANLEAEVEKRKLPDIPPVRDLLDRFTERVGECAQMRDHIIELCGGIDGKGKGKDIPAALTLSNDLWEYLQSALQEFDYGLKDLYRPK